MKRRFSWWLSAVLLYLLSVPIIFILIGLLALIVTIIANYFGHFSSVFWYFLIMYMVYIGAPLSLLSSLFVPPSVLGAIHKKRTRKLRQAIWRRRC